MMQELINTIQHSDALELLAKLDDASIDMILCDLPYGVLENSWDSIIPFEPMWKEFRRITKDRAAIVLTATEPFASHLRMSAIDLYKYDWVWQKDGATDAFRAKLKPMNEHEMILVFSKGTVANRSERLMNYYPQGVEKANIKKSQNSLYSGGGIKQRKSWKTIYTVEQTNYPKTILSYTRDADGFHPTQKPVALFEYLIKTYTQENDLVLDVCVGSGTTALACQNLGRRFIAGDSSLEYVEAARLRLQNADPMQHSILKTGERQLSLFANLDTPP